MSDILPLNFRRCIERQWAGRIQPLGQILAQIAVATERMLQRAFNNGGPMIPVPVRAVADRRRFGRSHD